jgi:7-carboxy-7-deazaguanine synthase
VARVAQWTHAKHVVLTGGEPMVAREIHDLAERLRRAGYHLTIETAATIAPDGIACDLASLSPKLKHATPLAGEIASGWIEKHERTRIQPIILKSWAEQGLAQFKFVVAAESDLDEIRDLFALAMIDPLPDRVLLMPEGRTLAELKARQDWLVEVCKATGYRYCQRLHIDLFGNQRGT